MQIPTPEELAAVGLVKYAPKEADIDRAQNNFTYHPAKEDQLLRYETVRTLLLNVAAGLHVMCPPSRELSLALTKLEEAGFWANASIARNE